MRIGKNTLYFACTEISVYGLFTRSMQLTFEDMGGGSLERLEISSLEGLMRDLLKRGVWEKEIENFLNESVFSELAAEIEKAYSKGVCFPAPSNIFKALELTSLQDCKVVILGQDPYHGPGQAMGLSFSVPDKVKLPPSLRNIFKEREDDLKAEPRGGDLSDLARQGVLLLNRVLTVEMSKAGSHRGFGWEQFTETIIKAVNSKKDGVVFILWGSDAHKVESLIDAKKHRIIKSVHPSPLSAYRGFFGSKPFSATNKALKELGHDEISW